MVRDVAALVSFVQYDHLQEVEGIVDDECCYYYYCYSSPFDLRRSRPTYLPASTGLRWFWQCSVEVIRRRRCSWARIRGVVCGRVFSQFGVRPNGIYVISLSARRGEAWTKRRKKTTTTVGRSDYIGSWFVPLDRTSAVLPRRKLGLHPPPSRMSLTIFSSSWKNHKVFN